MGYKVSDIRYFLLLDMEDLLCLGSGPIQVGPSGSVPGNANFTALINKYVDVRQATAAIRLAPTEKYVLELWLDPALSDPIRASLLRCSVRTYQYRKNRVIRDILHLLNRD